MKISQIFTLMFLGASLASHAQTFVSTTPGNKNAVLEEFTGIHCQYCPDGHRIANLIHDNHPGRVVLVNVHAGSYAVPSTGDPDYRTAQGNALNTYATSNGLTGYPAGTMNRHNFGAGIITGRGNWTADANTILGQLSPVNVAARCTINLDTRALRMTVESYYTANGTGTTDRLNVYLTQDNIIGPQTAGSTWNPSQVTADGQYIHGHMLRAALTPTWGDVIPAVTTGSFDSKTYTYTIPSTYTNIPAVIPNMKVAVFVADSVSEIVTGNYAQVVYEANQPINVQTQGALIDEADYGLVCGSTVSPVLSYMNTGSNAISTVTVQYTINGGTAQTYTTTLTTPAAIGDMFQVQVPNIAIGTGANNLSFSITQINGTAFTGTNTLAATATQAANITNAVDTATFSLTFDSYPEETYWTFKDETSNTVIASVTGGSYTTATNPAGSTLVTKFPLIDGHCYSIEVKDVYGDGNCCAYGNGNFNVVVGADNVITSNGQYGSGTGKKFTWSRLGTGVTKVDAANEVRLFPNPTRDNITLEFNLDADADMNIDVINALGQTVKNVNSGNLNAGYHNIQINTSEFASGAYFVVIRNTKNVTTKQFSVIR